MVPPGYSFSIIELSLSDIDVDPTKNQFSMLSTFFNKTMSFQSTLFCFGKNFLRQVDLNPWPLCCNAHTLPLRYVAPFKKFFQELDRFFFFYADSCCPVTAREIAALQYSRLLWDPSVMDSYFGTFPVWADFLSFCFNDCSKVWRLILATKMKILSWKFVGNLLLGIRPTGHR